MTTDDAALDSALGVLRSGSVIRRAVREISELPAGSVFVLVERPGGPALVASCVVDESGGVAPFPVSSLPIRRPALREAG